MKSNALTRLLCRSAVPVAAAMLVACAADGLDGPAGTNPTPPGGTAVTEGTVSFTNNTAMTIGSLPDLAARPAAVPAITRAASLQVEGNGACKLMMPVQPVPGDGADVAESDNIDRLVAGGAAVVVPAGAQCGLGPEANSKDGPAVLTGDIFVYGTLTVTDFTGGGGRIIVADGGKLIITDGRKGGGKQPLLSDVSVLCYDGGTLTLYADADLGPNGSLMAEGDLNIYDKGVTLGAGSELYAGGNLTCTGLETTGDGALLHVVGDLKTNAADNEVLKLQHPADVCVEGTMTVWNLDVTAAAHVHVDCRLIAHQGVNLDGGGEICASYIETPDLNVCQNKHDAPSKIWMTDGGVVNVSGNLDIGSPSAFFGIYGSPDASKALIDTKNISASSGVKDLTGIVDPAYYINYGNATNVDAFPSPERVNAPGVSINKGGGECNPGFTVPDPDDPDPGTDPDPDPDPENPDEPDTPDPDEPCEPTNPTGEGEINVPIDLDFDHEYTLSADDFAIRVNGDYVEDITVSGNSATSVDGITVTDENHLNINISGLSYDYILDGNDYTYEVYLWVYNRKPLGGGSDKYGPLFTEELLEEWVNPEWEKPLGYDPYGCDMTSRVEAGEFGTVTSPAGYTVRYNVYRGVKGHVDPGTGLGDTPYVKVSIHVQKDPCVPADTNYGVYPGMDEAAGGQP